MSWLVPRHWIVCFLFAMVLFPVLTLGQAKPKPEPNGDIVFREGLTIRPVGKYGRNPLHQDAIETKIVQGTWTPPRVGETVALPGGETRSWEPLVATPDGNLQNAALDGGYAYFAIDSATDRVMLLEARAHSLVYVNGELRVGDPYETGKPRVPVTLHKGSNTFLFLCGRGHLQARLTTPKSPFILETNDPTLPDLIVGETKPVMGALVVLNTTASTLVNAVIETEVAKGRPQLTILPPLPPMSMRKVRFLLQPVFPPMADKVSYHIRLLARKGRQIIPLDAVDVAVRIRKLTETYRRTFVSKIDGSVQYYAVNPMRSAPRGSELPALFLSLHGASVEALGQAEAYLGKTWGYIVAPTNRRPYGFDWEDWGRIDAIEVLDQAQALYKTDPHRTYLTGHSMGGHGTWQIGATFPNRFAAIGPSAGWVSMWSYAGAQRPQQPSPMQEMLLHGAASSDTLAMAHNYLAEGVYILHGDADDNVPVIEARSMATCLAGFHHDYTLFEQPGAGHWWGNSDEPGAACVDWPAMFDMFARHRIPDDATIRDVDFTTMNPGVSSELRWVRIEAQKHSLIASSVRIHFDPGLRRFIGTTENVARLSLDVSVLDTGGPISVQLDGQKLTGLMPTAGAMRLWFVRHGKTWQSSGIPELWQKGIVRNGPFKAAFDNRMIFVYGTKGTEEENAWSYARARYDAETFWYRGNGSVDVVADMALNPAVDQDRSIILYGNGETNGVWNLLLPDSPVQVKRGQVTVGNHTYSGDNLACLFVRPRGGSIRSCIAAVSGTGSVGMRLTDRMPYFVSGVGYPDCIVLGPETLTVGTAGVRVAGFFGQDWSVEEGEFVW